MSKENHTSLLFQIRIDLAEETAIEIRNKVDSIFSNNINNILKKVKAELVCQYDAFKKFVLECEEENEVDNALYKWTKDTIENKFKKQKYLKSFTVYVEGEQLYKKKIADFLEYEIKKLNEKKIIKINKYNSDPKNNPQPPKKYL